MILPIASIWNPILCTICDPIQDINTSQIQELAKSMIDTLESVWWIGIAAPQVWENARMFIMRLKPTPRFPELVDNWPIVVINPVISYHGEKTDIMREWCLSIPWPDFESQLFGDVLRRSDIQVSYYNEQNQHILARLEWVSARVFQHKYDHLDGILFLERMDNLKSLVSGAEIERRKNEKSQNL